MNGHCGVFLVFKLSPSSDEEVSPVERVEKSGKFVIDFSPRLMRKKIKIDSGNILMNDYLALILLWQRALLCGIRKICDHYCMTLSLRSTRHTSLNLA